MFERYLTIKENKIVCGQTGSGVWYCKELPADNTRELDVLVGEVNCVLNKYNSDAGVKAFIGKDVVVKGLK